MPGKGFQRVDERNSTTLCPRGKTTALSDIIWCLLNDSRSWINDNTDVLGVDLELVKVVQHGFLGSHGVSESLQTRNVLGLGAAHFFSHSLWEGLCPLFQHIVWCIQGYDMVCNKSKNDNMWVGTASNRGEFWDSLQFKVVGGSECRLTDASYLEWFWCCTPAFLRSTHPPRPPRL